MNRHSPSLRLIVPVLAILVLLTGPSVALAESIVPVEQVPEPTSLVLLGMGYAVASIAAYRRKKTTPVE